MEEEGVQCTICLQESDAPVHKLPCGHAFHTECVMHWFREGHNECPNCRSCRVSSRLTFKTPAQRIAILRRRKTLAPVVREQLRRHDTARVAMHKTNAELRAFSAEHKRVLQRWNHLRACRIRQTHAFLRTQRHLSDLTGDVPFYIHENSEVNDDSDIEWHVGGP
jgi:hypothetical protein